MDQAPPIWTPAPEPAPRRQPIAVAIVSTALLALMIAAQWGWIWAVAGVAGLFVHECGHLIMINALGCGPGRLVIIPFLGGAATMARPPRSDFGGVIIALAGPVFGLLAALPFLVLAAAQHDPRWAGGAMFIALINLLNLAPAPPLDGSKALGPALARIHPWLERAAMVVLGAAAAAVMIARGSVLLGAFIGIAALGALRRGPARPIARPLTLVEWVATCALWVTSLGLGALVLGYSAFASGRSFTG